MITNFQRKLITDYDTLWKVVKAFHPDLGDEHFERFKSKPTQVKGGVWKDLNHTVSTKYDWVTIEYKVPGYGQIALRLENCNDKSDGGMGLFGSRVTKKDMQKAIDKGYVNMYVGRFATDKLHVPDYSKEGDPVPLAQSIEILKQAGYQIQSVDEWYKIYYKS